MVVSFQSQFSVLSNTSSLIKTGSKTTSPHEEQTEKNHLTSKTFIFLKQPLTITNYEITIKRDYSSCSYASY